MKKRSNMNHGQVFKMYSYCQDNQDLLTNKTVDQIFVIVNRDLEFEVSKSALKTALEELNIFYTKPRRGRKKNADISALKCQIKTLAIAVKELYDDMGSKIHPGVVDIINLYTK